MCGHLGPEAMHTLGVICVSCLLLRVNLVKLWNRLPRAVAVVDLLIFLTFPTLEVFKKLVNVALHNVV